MNLNDLDQYDFETLIEISNGRGDHYVASVPDKAVKNVEFTLEQAGAVPDTDESLSQKPNAERVHSRRDLNEFRYRSAKAFTRDENLEDSYDREGIDEREPEESDNDEIIEDDRDLEPDCDGEASWQPATLNPLTWHRPQQPPKTLETRPNKTRNSKPLVRYEEDYEQAENDTRSSSRQSEPTASEELKANIWPWSWHRPQ